MPTSCVLIGLNSGNYLWGRTKELISSTLHIVSSMQNLIGKCWHDRYPLCTNSGILKMMDLHKIISIRGASFPCSLSSQHHMMITDGYRRSWLQMKLIRSCRWAPDVQLWDTFEIQKDCHVQSHSTNALVCWTDHVAIICLLVTNLCVYLHRQGRTTFLLELRSCPKMMQESDKYCKICVKKNKTG